jgi:hypothetical protein
MSEEDKKTDTKTEQTINNDGKDASVDENGVSEAKEGEAKSGAVDTQAKDGNEGSTDNTESKKTQTREENAKFAALRRQKEGKPNAPESKANESEIEKQAELKGKLSVLTENPYTKKPIKDEYDLKVYEAQKKLDGEGKDPINDLPDYLAEQDRQSKKEELASKEASQKATDQAIEEVNELRKAHPDLDPNELANNQDFLKFAEGKWGRWTLNEMYEAFTAKNITPKEPTKPKTSSPSSIPQGTPAGQKDPLKMTPQEYQEMKKKESGNWF